MLAGESFPHRLIQQMRADFLPPRQTKWDEGREKNSTDLDEIRMICNRLEHRIVDFNGFGLILRWNEWTGKPEGSPGGSQSSSGSAVWGGGGTSLDRTRVLGLILVRSKGCEGEEYLASFRWPVPCRLCVSFLAYPCLTSQ